MIAAKGYVLVFRTYCRTTGLFAMREQCPLSTLLTFRVKSFVRIYDRHKMSDVSERLAIRVPVQSSYVNVFSIAVTSKFTKFYQILEELTFIYEYMRRTMIFFVV